MVSNTADRGYETYAADAPEGETPRSFPAKLAKLLLARHRAGAAADHALSLRADARQRQDIARGGAQGPRRLERSGAGAALDRRGLHLGQFARRPHRLAAARAAGRGGGALRVVGDRRPARASRSPCRHADIVVTNDLKRYERLKLFILNLGHTWLAEIWRRRNGAPAMTVREAMADEAMRAELGRSL